MLCCIIDYDISIENEISIVLYNNNNYYNLRIKWNADTCFGRKLTIVCDCNLSTFFTPCNHIKWFGSNFLNSKDPREWNISCLEIFKERYTNYKIIYGNNYDCPICLENLLYNKQNTIVCNKCNNGVHMLCWNKFRISSIYEEMHTKCILCQSQTMPKRTFVYSSIRH
jgi:hypothetical protein